MTPYTHTPGIRLFLSTEKGFSLIEVMVGIVILTAGLLAMASLLISVMHGNKLSRDLTTATLLAKSSIEEMETLGFFGTPSTDTVTVEAYNSIPGYLTYKRVTSVDANNPTVGMKKIGVTVYWASDAHSCELQTIMAK